MMISVITATYNAMGYLPDLLESLRQQEDKDFEWVVSDGASTDGTVNYLESINDLNIKILSQEDFGIYDALNRGIKESVGDFYIVIGADDVFYPNAIGSFKSAFDNYSDIITLTIDIGNKKSKPVFKRRLSWYFGQFSYVSGHAVGTMFRKSLHEKNGYYSKRFPIAADQYFILKSIKNGAAVKFKDELVGMQRLVGVSSIDKLGTNTERFRIQVEVGYNKYVQFVLLVLRIFKNLLF